MESTDTQTDPAVASVDAAEDDIQRELDCALRTIDLQVDESHDELDAIEVRLLALRDRQNELAAIDLRAPASRRAKRGSVDELDLGSLIAMAPAED